MNLRVIPKLDIKGPNLVKGIHFEGLRVLGKPEYFARHYAENGADELVYMDAVASLYERNSLLHIVEKTAAEIHIPLTVGGGLRGLDDIREMLRAGADKVSINTAAIKRPELIREAARRFGSSTIVVSVEAYRTPSGGYEAYTDYGRQGTGIDAVEWAVRAVELGAGELLVTSIEREGTGLGFDLELTRRIADLVPVPVIAAGGAGTPAHVLQVVQDGHADAVCLASLLHYHCVTLGDFHDGDFQGEGNTLFLSDRGRGFSKIQGTPLADLKRLLSKSGVPCRV
ncbi:imidazole glycerol phosphate synthase subunit HisF [bacterium CPR1]|nr:imidazole glycerol phosphate synthase subunit HisF [bacterium CPR1]